ncbi:MAG: glycosyltransferase family 2 protein [Planctomycetia bacterium]|nr:glycosyltransferase family 2 protein [Planctomycetia bacterium]
MSLSASIAMCTYNGAKFLEKQLQSFLEQTVLPDELIVCDDGSTDGTVKILESFAAKSPFPVQIHRNEKNLGYVRNFEKAGALCSKEIVYFSDQDDIWLPEKNEKTLNIFQEYTNIGLVLLNAQLMDAQDNLLPVSARAQKQMDREKALPDAEPFFVINGLHRWIVSWQGCNMAYRNSQKELIYPVGSEMGHDQWILLLLGVLSDTVFLRQPTLLHRIHSDNASRLSCIKRNLISRAFYSIRRHQDPFRYELKASLFEHLLERIRKNQELIRHPELLPVFERFFVHLSTRAEALRNPWKRPKLLLREWLNGNYGFCSRGFSDVLSDFLAFPIKK